MRKFFVFVFMLICITAGLYFANRYYNDEYLPQKKQEENIKRQEKLYETIKPDIPPKNTEESTNPETPEIPKETDILKNAKLVTNDVVGWISVDGTEIDFPVVQSADNDFYLWRGVDGEENGLGTPFLDYRCAPDFSEYNWIIYGHNIENFGMFGRLQDFMQEDYFNTHETGTLVVGNEIYQINFFAYLSQESTSPVYNTIFITHDDRIGYAELILRLARFKRDITAEELAEKRIVLLSTCNFEFEESRGLLVGYID
ncbi:MAG: sortase [Ruminococcus sp.]|nr:sortase [Ruminococcus sp.]MBR6384706.1 sortase [Ruminococcus sp.]